MTESQSLVERLAGEADAHADQATQSPGFHPDWRAVPHPDWHAVRDAKFAELMANECASACLELFDLRDDERARMHAAKCATAIRQRFGVGE